MGLIFTINGAPVALNAGRRVDPFVDGQSLVAAVYNAFSILHRSLPLTSLAINGNAVLSTVVLTTVTGATMTYFVTLDSDLLNPLVAPSTTGNWRWLDLAATRLLFEAVVNLVLSTTVGTFLLENT